MNERAQQLGQRFEEALVFATQAHAAQQRKGTEIPYVGHLLGVTSLVIDDGGDEDEAVAALLHDVVEDQGGAERLAEIRERFGPCVAKIVSGCSDADIVPKPPWRKRKEAYLEHLRAADASVVRVSLADKLHNARAILLDYRRHGDRLWQRFNPEADQLWYYRSLVDVYRCSSDSPLVEELARVVADLEREMNEAARAALPPLRKVAERALAAQVRKLRGEVLDRDDRARDLADVLVETLPAEELEAALADFARVPAERRARRSGMRRSCTPPTRRRGSC
jgi:(p)ppGpp synthase/HD superfamily hydrolase